MGVVVYEPLSGFPHTLVLIGAKIPVDLFGICGFGSHDASRHLSRLLMCHLTDLPPPYLTRFSGLGTKSRTEEVYSSRSTSPSHAVSIKKL